MPNDFKSKSNIIFGDTAYQTLDAILSSKSTSTIFVLCDENTQAHCVPFFLQQIQTEIDPEIIEIPSGEDHKDIATCQQIWKTLSDLGGDRTSILINLGGGIITDMGGFVASTFLRGIDFINIPTTLLGMVDAAIGGKTGVNRDDLKNQIGVFNFPLQTLIDIRYLGSLAQRQLKSGLAEMLKHGLIVDKKYWENLSDLKQLTVADLEDLVRDSITIKTGITEKDETESHLRKKLNFGHTLGHAIESYCLDSAEKETLLHGEAIAIGMILESFLSTKICGLPEKALNEIKSVILNTFTKVEFTQNDIAAILKLLKYDKKTNRGQVNFVLLEAIGKARIDQRVSNNMLYDAFAFYAQD